MFYTCCNLALQKTAGGKQFVDVLLEQGIYPGIKVDTGLQVTLAHHPHPFCQ